MRDCVTVTTILSILVLLLETMNHLNESLQSVMIENLKFKLNVELELEA